MTVKSINKNIDTHIHVNALNAEVGFNKANKTSIISISPEIGAQTNINDSFESIGNTIINFNGTLSSFHNNQKIISDADLSVGETYFIKFSSSLIGLIDNLKELSHYCEDHSYDCATNLDISLSRLKSIKTILVTRIPNLDYSNSRIPEALESLEQAFTDLSEAINVHNELDGFASYEPDLGSIYEFTSSVYNLAQTLLNCDFITIPHKLLLQNDLV